MSQNGDARRVLRDPILFLAFGLGSGLVPRMPGTAGSLAGLLLFLPMFALPFGGRLLLVAALCLVGIVLCGVAARRLNTHDHPGIVWDEFCGMWLTLLVVPADVFWILGAFGLFRLFDIWKPWPIRYLDKNVPGGLGIMLDDIIAALYAATILLVAMFLI
ncbi:MAG: phosphatidylglycerophosphatase A [Gammaproteobacteria bacterium]